MNAPDLAAGDFFGAEMSNMVTLGFIDLLYRHKRVWQQAAFESWTLDVMGMRLVFRQEDMTRRQLE